MEATIVTHGGITREEAQQYLEYLERKYGRCVEYLETLPDGHYVNLKYRLHPVPIERIRRITGYLVGDMSKWNDAKTAEEQNRTKHDLTRRDLEVMMP